MVGIWHKILAVILAGASCASLAKASDQAPLFISTEQALAFVQSFGPNWKNAREVPMKLKWNGLKVRRFLFGDLHAVDVRLDHAGQVQSILVADFNVTNPAARISPRKCAMLPDYDQFAELLVQALEPKHTTANMVFAKGVAKRGWTPSLGMLTARINSTIFSFESFRGCKVEIAKVR